MKIIKSSLAVALLTSVVSCATVQKSVEETTQQPLPIDTTKGWVMTWNDEFDYPDDQLEEKWKVQNSASGGGIVIGSRWRENVEVKDGLLYLTARKESRGGQDWTSGSIWTNREFHFGYMECRYKYAEGPGLNNAFWTWNSYKHKYPYELDINEGHYPNLINSNYHDRRDTTGMGFKGYSESMQHRPNDGPELLPYNVHEFEKPLKASKIRFTSRHLYPFTMGEFRIYAPNANGYPKDVRSDNADTEVEGLVNLSRRPSTVITSSGCEVSEKFNGEAKNVADGKVSGINSSWRTPNEEVKWLEFDLGSIQEVGCVQFNTGWKHGKHWRAMIADYEIEYFDGKEWIKAVDFNQAGTTDYSAEFHTYGMLWGETELTYYFDNKPIRTIKYEDLKNPVLSPTKIYLSLAVLGDAIAGILTEATDGASMKVDWVRYYEYKPE